jgi:hypothetical protein
MASPSDREREILGLPGDITPSSTAFTPSPPTAGSSLGLERDSSNTSSQRHLTSNRNMTRFSPKAMLSNNQDSEDISLAEKQPADVKSQFTDFTENTIVPRRHLGFIQTTSLMLNGCFAGSFFFGTPLYTLSLVRSKRICLVLWAVGGIYSALG